MNKKYNYETVEPVLSSALKAKYETSEEVRYCRDNDKEFHKIVREVAKILNPSNPNEAYEYMLEDMDFDLDDMIDELAEEMLIEEECVENDEIEHEFNDEDVE